MNKTEILWCDYTWNPVVGCTKISDGCKNCYAEKIAHRLKAMGIPWYDRVVKKCGWTGEVGRPGPAVLAKPPKERAIIFVCSMGDLFHPAVRVRWIDEIFDVIENHKQHTFIILTKRPERLCDYGIRWGAGCFPKNVWVGTSISTNRDIGNIEYITRIPSPVRMVSLEPLLEKTIIPEQYFDSETSWSINWIVVGGESGSSARPLKPVWIRSIRDQCINYGVPFFFKQWGSSKQYRKLSALEGQSLIESGYNPTIKNGGNVLDGTIHNEKPIIELNKE